MPTYIYRCDNGHEIEKFEPMGAPVEQTCPACPDTPCEEGDYCTLPHLPGVMRRQIGAGSGFTFKGGAPTRKFHKRG